VIPVARRVWQPIGAAIPAAAARRRIMRQASGWLMGRDCSIDAVPAAREIRSPACLDELTRSTIGRAVGRLSEARTAAVQYKDRQIS
jgi:hypothetical protein